MFLQRLFKLFQNIDRPTLILGAGGFVAVIMIVVIFSRAGANATEVIHIIGPEGGRMRHQTPPPPGLSENPQKFMPTTGIRDPLGNNLGGKPQLIPELGVEVIGLSQGAAGITGVMGNSLAEKAGLQRNDVLVSFNKTDITGIGQLRRLVQKAPPERKCPIEIFRDGRIKSLFVMVGEGEMEGFTPIVPVTFTRPGPLLKF